MSDFGLLLKMLKATDLINYLDASKLTKTHNKTWLNFLPAPRMMS